jgi:hypothetical protein
MMMDWYAVYSDYHLIAHITFFLISEQYCTDMKSLCVCVYVCLNVATCIWLFVQSSPNHQTSQNIIHIMIYKNCFDKI